jgi:hypothetical protein
MAQILLVNLTFIEKFIMLNGEVENENRSAEEFFYMFVDISFFFCVFDVRPDIYPFGCRQNFSLSIFHGSVFFGL